MKHHTKVIVGLRIIWVDFQGLFIRSDCLLIPSEFIIGKTEIAVYLYSIRFKLQRLIEYLYRLFVSAEVDVYRP